MNYFLKHLLVASLVILGYHGVVESSIFTISDERVRSMDVTPALGRGYSIMTNQFHSTCLTVETTTTPSYNYDCKFMNCGSPLLLVSQENNRNFDCDSLYK